MAGLIQIFKLKYNASFQGDIFLNLSSKLKSDSNAVVELGHFSQVFRQDRNGQTLQTWIRFILKEGSDQGL